MRTADREDTRPPLVGAPGALAEAHRSPPGPAGRAVAGDDGDTELFQASTEPTEIGLWASVPAGPPDRSRARLEAGTRAGGTTVVSRLGLDEAGVDGRCTATTREAAELPSLAARPALRRPGRSCSVPGRGEFRTAVLYPTEHRQGTRATGAARPLRRPARAAVLQRPVRRAGPRNGSPTGVRRGHRGRPGYPGPRPERERAVGGDLAGPSWTLRWTRWREAAARFTDLDLEPGGDPGLVVRRLPGRPGRVAPPGPVPLRRSPAPRSPLALYDTAYTERYLGLPTRHPRPYDHSSLFNGPTGGRAPPA